MMRFLFIALCVTAPATAGLFRVSVHQDAVIMGYRLSEESHRRDRLRDALAKHQVELAAQLAPSHLQRWAEEHHLLAPRPEQVLMPVGSPRANADVGVQP